MSSTLPDAGHRWLVLRLEAPLLAFGGVAIDAVGVTRDYPAASMLTGLLANALGWKRTQAQDHQVLQDHLLFGARRDRAFPILTDNQNARLGTGERGWTTWGQPERSGGGALGTHRRQRDYHADACVRVVLRLASGQGRPPRALSAGEHGLLDLDTLAAALERPARPLFIGRKACLPSGPIRRPGPEGEVFASTVHEALSCLPRVEDSGCAPWPALWPRGEGPETGRDVDRVTALPDLRNWHTGLHGGTRMVVEGRIRDNQTRGAAT